MADQASAARAYAGFPVPARQWRGDSAVGAALRSGNIPPGGTLSAVEQSLRQPATQYFPRFDRRTGERIPPPDDFFRRRTPVGSLRARFPNLRRHFVFEYYPWYETNPYYHWAEKGS